MRATIHQPVYLPWLGYFHKMAQGDIHVFLDDAQYSKNNLFNRNVIPAFTGELWLTVPVKYKGNSTAAIREIKIDNTQKWRKKHWQTIRHIYGKAPFWKTYGGLFEKIYQRDWEFLADLNMELAKLLAGLFGIKVKFIRSSGLGAAGVKNERLINICRAVGADVYISGAGARAYMDESLFLARGIKVQYQQFSHPSRLSAVDFLFKCGGEKFKEVCQ